MSRLLAWGVLLLFSATLVAVPSRSAAAQGNRPKVVATFSVVGDLAQNVGGDRIDLITLVGKDGDTERYEPTPADARALLEASLILENGLGSEPWLDRQYAASRSQAPRVRISQDVTLRRGEENELDPHVWHDVANAIVMTRTIRDAMVGVDGANAATYAANADAYIARLQTLDRSLLDQIATLAPERRKLVTSHDTFGYFADRYGFEVLGVGLQSFFTDAQPSAQQVARLVQDIRSTGVRAVFIENVTDPRLMQQVAAEAGVAVAPELYTDALGPDGSPASTYIDMMSYNVGTIVTALNR